MANNRGFATSRRLLWSASGSMAALALMGAPALAQNQTPAQTPVAQSAGDGAIGDVVVTARRTEERLQSTPIAATALTQAALKQRQITDLFSLQYSAPDLIVGQTGNDAGATVSLRGQVTVASEVNVDQSVGVYQDGVYSARQQGGLLDLIDVQRVEVLRGPQGTLFGRNTTGGAINIIANKPTDDFEGWLRIGAGNYGELEESAVINAPLIGDQLDARLVYEHQYHGGYGRNLLLDSPVGDLDSNYLRAEVKIAPDQARWNLLLEGDYTNNNNHGQVGHLVAFNAAALPAADQAALNDPYYDNSSFTPQYDHLRSGGGSATLTVDLGKGLTFKSITAERAYSHDDFADYPGGPVPFYFTLENTTQNQFSEEAQLFGQTDKLNWIAGFYYFQEHAHQVYTVDSVYQYNGIFDNSSIGGYAQGTYHLTPKLRITGGIRYTVDERNLLGDNEVLPLGSFCLLDAGIVDPGTFCLSHRHASFSYPSYTAGVDYQFSPNIFVYFTTAMAHKSGGIGAADNLLEIFDPEQVTNYELGAKTDWLDHHLRVNVATFIAYYNHMQRPITAGSGAQPVVLTQSIGAAEIPGAELEVTAIPIQGLELTGNVAWLNPYYTDFHDLTGDHRGEPFTYVSKLTWGVGATYTVPVSYGKYQFHIDYAFQSDKYFFPPIASQGITPPAGATSNYDLQPGFGLLNAKVSLALTNSGLELSLWGKNLTGQKYNSFVSDFVLSAAEAEGLRGDPRTFGATLTWNFGGR